jgi:hypothetical protein
LPDVRCEIDRVLACDDRVIATRLGYRGRETHREELVGCVTVVESGRGVSVDYYDYYDEAAMRRRYHELGGYPIAFADRPPERLVAATYRYVAAGDLKRIGELHAKDAVILDHRALAWDAARGRSAIERLYESGMTAFPDLWLDVEEVLACDARVMALRYKLRGHGTDGGGEIEVPQGSVVLVHDGQMARVELYDIDDRPAMLARYEELGGRN